MAGPDAADRAELSTREVARLLASGVNAHSCRIEYVGCAHAYTLTGMFTRNHAGRPKTATIGNDRWDRAQIVTQSLKTGRRQTLIGAGSDARYVQTGHLLYVVGGVLFAVPFDVKRLAVVGGPTPIVPGLLTALAGPLPAERWRAPSPNSAGRGFFGTKPFSEANELLEQQGGTPIDWKLP